MKKTLYEIISICFDLSKTSSWFRHHSFCTFVKIQKNLLCICTGDYSAKDPIVVVRDAINGVNKTNFNENMTHGEFPENWIMPGFIANMPPMSKQKYTIIPLNFGHSNYRN